MVGRTLGGFNFQLFFTLYNQYILLLQFNKVDFKIKNMLFYMYSWFSKFLAENPFNKIFVYFSNI